MDIYIKINVSIALNINQANWFIDGTARRKESLRRPRRKWMDNIKTDLGEVGWDGMA
jgi:hypothetical protein